MLLKTDYYQTVSKVGSNVLSGYLGINVSTLEYRQMDTPLLRNVIAVHIKLLGQVEGQIICSMNENTAKHIVGCMYGGMIINELDEMGISAIQEFGNWFVSGIATEFSNHGLKVDISHPTVSIIQSVMSLRRHNLVPLQSEYGTIDIYSSFEIEG
jgi:chemotaxis protein CheX